MVLFLTLFIVIVRHSPDIETFAFLYINRDFYKKGNNFLKIRYLALFINRLLIVNDKVLRQYSIFMANEGAIL